MKEVDYKHKLWEKIQKEQQRCFDWHVKFTRNGVVKLFSMINKKNVRKVFLTSSFNETKPLYFSSWRFW